MKLIRSLQSEWLKKSKSAVNWLTIVGGLFIPVIIITLRLVQHNKTLIGNSSNGIWMKLFHQSWQYLSIFLLPMGIILAASLITQIEYRNNGWKQLFTSPQSLSSIFLVKYIVVIFILIQFFILFTLGIYLTGLIPSFFYSDVPYPKEQFPIWEYTSSTLNFFIDCLPILAIQYLLSLHIKNFIISIGVGLIMLVASLFAMNWEHGNIFPYCYASLQFLKADNKISSDVNIQAWAISYFLFFSFLNYIIFIFKYNSKSFFHSR